MMETLGELVRGACERVNGDRTRLLDVAEEVQARLGWVPNEARTLICSALGVKRIEVESLLSFYSFLSTKPQGRSVIRLCDDVPDRMAGFDAVKTAFEEELSIKLGETTPDGVITLTRTACIGMCDQAPSALVNDTVITDLDPSRAREIVRGLREHGDPHRLVTRLGDGQNANSLVLSMVRNNIRQAGPVILAPGQRGRAVMKALNISPAEVIRAVKTARLRGRGGAGFPTGMKWEFTRVAPGERRFVICNADEGEPGTFKDRVLLTEFPDRVFAGMTIAGYAIGAEAGILYLRGEYAYLRPYLESVLQRRRQDGLLGDRLCGKHSMSFDIRIQMGAGAYVCGEETALISSAEGARGDPKNRPPFPAQKGYLGYPTVVNNVETLCAVTKIMELGATNFCEHGTEQSSGTKLLSISGDVNRPGVYEVPFGITLAEVLALAGGEDAVAAQVGGPSGTMVSRADFKREITYEDLSTGGAIVVFDKHRDLLEVVHTYLEFFAEESCGYCTPCRVGNVLLKEGIERLMAGRGEPGDLTQFRELGETMKKTSRCGLGQSSWRPVVTTMDAFPEVFAAKVGEDPDGFRRAFDLEREIGQARAITGRGGRDER
jgi:[NiFe] hydrogenase diaphorase moiety large subunit